MIRQGERAEGGGGGGGSDFSLWTRETGVRRRVYVSTEDGHYDVPREAGVHYSTTAPGALLVFWEHGIHSMGS